MFERGKRDEALEQGSESRSTEPYRSYEAPAAKSSDRSSERKGECAVIGRSIQIEGAVRGNEDLRIEGDVSGTVELKDSSLTIGKEGKVRADVYAKSIIVDGTTEGDLYATNRVVVRVTAQGRGIITPPNASGEEVANFNSAAEVNHSGVQTACHKPNVPSATETQREKRKKPRLPRSPPKRTSKSQRRSRA